MLYPRMHCHWPLVMDQTVPARHDTTLSSDQIMLMVNIVWFDLFRVANHSSHRCSTMLTLKMQWTLCFSFVKYEVSIQDWLFISYSNVHPLTTSVTTSVTTIKTQQLHLFLTTVKFCKIEGLLNFSLCYFGKDPAVWIMMKILSKFLMEITFLVTWNN